MRVKRLSYEEEKENLLKDPSAPGMLAVMVHALAGMDPVDAAACAETLAALMRLRCREIAGTENGLASGLNDAGRYFLGLDKEGR